MSKTKKNRIFVVEKFYFLNECNHEKTYFFLSADCYGGCLVFFGGDRKSVV